MPLRIIDPPVTAYSSKTEVAAWLRKLQRMQPKDESVRHAIREAKALLDLVSQKT